MPSIRTAADFAKFCKYKPEDRAVAFDYWETASAFGNTLGNATFCETRKGYLGLVPGDVQVGDNIVIFKGAVVPFILRGTDGPDNYTLIGEAYIHGIMHGEALEMKSLVQTKLNIV